MEKKFTDFSFDEASRLASSTTGQQLLELLKQNPDGQSAAAAAQSGDMEQTKKALAGIMNSLHAQALLRQLWEEYHGRNER